MILDARRVRVTFVAVGTLYTPDSTEMPDVIIQIFKPFERLPTSVAVQAAGSAEEIAVSAFVIARLPRMVDQVFAPREALATLKAFVERLGIERLGPL